MINSMLSLALPGGHRGCLSILIWHRVLADPDPIFPEEMHARRFAQTLDWLKRHFNVLPLTQAVAMLAQGCLPSRALAITFDDGYADNLHIATPILESHGLSATFFIATGFLDGGRMWNDTVIESVRRWRGDELDAGEFGRFAISDAASRRGAIDGLLAAIKYLDFEARNQAVASLAERCELPLHADLMMSSDEVRKLANSGQSIGAHTQFHPILARVSAGQAQREIEEGKRELETIVNAPVTLFAYPNGRPGQDYKSEHVEMVKAAGFTAAVSTAVGASRGDADLFQLRRFSPWDRSRARFLARMTMNAMRQVERA
ncbi:polysaccharide deacetylase family protein [Roseateles sp.]|uniref:polysaccharide deacetylase family protein n=1 Tax=Roseateles sp. TaxID=1971397 RepID=UPI00286C9532|nr:polysaccharide deacetylase family protein [Roseateles sp.]